MQDPNAAQTFSEVLGHWHEFYALLGTASATLVGLLFVAATVASGVFTTTRSAPRRMFLSASVIHFSTVLVVCLIVLAPEHGWASPGAMIVACGIFGLGYYGLAWRDAIRDGLAKAIDLEDRTWYAVFPAVGYLFETLSGAAMAARLNLSCVALAVSVGFVLMVGIHNAWDITIWSVTRPRDS
jgi:hypothetical protein